MKSRGTRSCVPITVGMLSLLVYAVPVMMWLKNAAPAPDDPKLKWLGIGAAVIFTAGTLGGTAFDAEILDKKLTAEQHLRLDAVIAAVWVLLMAICLVGGLLRLAVGMDLI
ncbi:MAG: hypothetical protein IKG82_13925 [Oscillospiraceae bacterium]|nr:hypothetical protein [Oscillospiraceae bacterium]MBR3419781.1 hypothetical protein [Oscillospiraceae bacterium]